MGTYKKTSLKEHLKSGELFVWGTGSALSLILLLATILLSVIVFNGMKSFWISDVAKATLKSGKIVMGEITREQKIPNKNQLRSQFKIGNRDLYGLDFKWVSHQQIIKKEFPKDAIVLERMENGNFYGFLKALQSPKGIPQGKTLWQQFEHLLDEVHVQNEPLLKVNSKIKNLGNQLSSIQAKIKKKDYANPKKLYPERATYLLQKLEIQKKFEIIVAEQDFIQNHLKKYSATFVDANGRTKQILLHEIVRHYQPNQMNVFDKLWLYLGKIKELFFSDPRESNTEGGLFPAIFGTVMMIFIMSIFSFPMGVIAAVYLREYAKEGVLLKTIRIGVNNLAGIPSIVYGIFGLGFFVYGIGGTIDQIFFPENLPAPTFGTGGILWASLTLALLTVPVVIVATEEALASVPKGMKEASLSLGATKFQTILNISLPMASPGIMTGFILAMARAAGEVAPLMITGVVKLAPSLPLDGNFPFLHLDRKFMHLGFHIYDVGFQSPNAEAAKPMVFVTTLLLILIVLTLSSVSISLRNRMEKKFKNKSF
ncbi:MAG: phosphate transport system permease protein [bacterium]|jgi:phosphate transport system permease protein